MPPSLSPSLVIYLCARLRVLALRLFFNTNVVYDLKKTLSELIYNLTLQQHKAFAATTSLPLVRTYRTINITLVLLPAITKAHSVLCYYFPGENPFLSFGRAI